MLTGLNALELGRLRLSVGYGTNKKGRPLSPIEVGQLVRHACNAGNTLAECATEIRIDETGLRRFLQILDLPAEIQHLVDWGGSKGVLSFSCATEVARISGFENQKAVAEAVLENRLTSKEVRQVAQLLVRSGRSVELCLEEVLGMRPIIERRYVFIGYVADENTQQKLNELVQRERDMILNEATDRIGLDGATGRLGRKIFTCVGDDRFGASMKKVGKENIEAKVRAYIEESLQHEYSDR